MSESDNNIEIQETPENNNDLSNQNTSPEEPIKTEETEEVINEETEEVVIEETDEQIEIVNFGKEPEAESDIIEEMERPRKPKQIVPVVDHRLLAGKLTVYDWLQDLPENECAPEVVEVRFKNTRKAFFSNPSQLKLKAGDIVAVEAALGHDIGIISLAGELVKEQMRLKRVDNEKNPLKKIYRKAKPHDIEKWQQAITLEHDTMIRSRKIAADLRLDMKIGDVEYQGDKTKAIFYYIAEDRVDFRTLIKVLAETFHIRIEMKQIGTRQEAGRIGGIGPCGLKLCCSTFITNFISVSTSAARYQDISLNPQKLAGQCGKLKCCLNYEVDAYIDEQKDFPSVNVTLNTGEGLLYHQKTDIFGRVMYYSFDKDGKGIFIKLPVRRIKEIIAMNRKGIIPPKANDVEEDETVDIKYTDGVGEESLSRFDEKRQKKRHQRNRNNRNGGSNAPQNSNGGNNNNESDENNNENKDNSRRAEGNNNNNNRNNRNNNRRNRNNRPAGNNNRPNQQTDQQTAPKPE